MKKIVFCIYNQKTIVKNPLVSFGNHTFHHYILSSLDCAKQESEIKLNHDFLTSLDINLSKIFSIPFGGYEHFNNYTLQLLKKYHYTGVLLSTNTLNHRRVLNHNGGKDHILPRHDRLLCPDDLRALQKKIVKIHLKHVLHI